MKKIIFISLTLFFLLTAGYAYTETVKEYSEVDSVIEANPGQIITITLESNKTTGFGWQLSGPLDKNIIEIVKAEYIPSNPRLIGAGGKEVWTFKALKAGKAVILLAYSRPWEKKIEPVKQKSFTVTIKEPSKN